MTRKMLVITSALVLIAVQAVAQSAAPIVLDDGTPIRLRTTQTLSSADAHVDDRVDFEVVDDVKVGDMIVIKHGTPAIGTVTQSQPKGRMGKGGMRGLLLTPLAVHKPRSRSDPAMIR